MTSTDLTANLAQQKNGLTLAEMGSLLEHMLNGVAYCRMLFVDGKADDFEYIYTNPAFHTQTGLGKVQGKLVSEVIPGLRESDASLFEIYGRVAKGGTPESFVLFIEGLQQWFSVSVYCPQIGYFVALFDVVTDRKNAERELEDRATQLRFVLEGSDLGFWDWNIAANTVIRNERWATMLGYTHLEIQQTTQQWSDFVHPEDRERAWQSIFDVVDGRAESHKAEYRMLHKNGSHRWILDQARVMQRDSKGKALRMCGTHTDITERKIMEEELRRQAHFDYLTGVFNRRHFMEQAEKELHRAIRYGNALSFLMLDIDHFKQINDRFGHKVGDQVLKGLASLCSTTLRDIDLFGRLGGEEFAVLLPQTDQDTAVEVAERLRQVIGNANVSLEGNLNVQFQVSIGVSSLRSKEDTIDALLNKADKALYEAKNTGRNRVCVFTSS
ncbi:diguanylate cyclase [Curvibacter sp. APW13]|uniref:sensor domain-containing diguanylate cyclase n=1 Tax=Curvibacter sp. APW13 TaxID=3077236 RepID=UPI0028DFBA7F|nr:diguanylate cyclase [Curvibacter sp. APW13]MDT8992648.1 diguanylate cyclase [Curvibacter sp. APW13]